MTELNIYSMQTLQVANKLTSKNQKTEQDSVNMRERKGESLSLSRNVFNLLGSKDVYYVQSERSENIYYYVKYNPDVFEYCSCSDNSIRGVKCKHIWSIEYSIRRNMLKPIEHLPENAQRYPQKIIAKNIGDDSEYDF